MLAWFKSLFGNKRNSKKIKGTVQAQAQFAKQQAPPRSAPMVQDKAPGARTEGEDIFPAALPGVGNLDRDYTDNIATRIEELLNKIGERIDKGEYDLPNLPATSMAILDLSSQPGIEISKMTNTLEQDPVMSSELLKTANSVFYGGLQQTDTVQQGVMRLGIKNLRGLIFAISMKNVIPRKRGLAHYAEEIWRQASSMAKIARELGPLVGMQSDNAFLLGLLQDIGKIALLDLLGKTTKSGALINRALIGELFNRYHEKTGAAMAAKWKLPEEIVSVCGSHHDFLANTDFPKSAAMASLIQKIDLYLSLGSQQEYWHLLQSKELEVLDFPYEVCRSALKKCVKIYSSGMAQPEPEMANS